MSRIGNEFKPLPAGRCDDLIDSTLRLTNGADLFATFVLGDGTGVIRGKYKAQVLGEAEAELKVGRCRLTL